jgi:membrane-associated phospholipid phosphatase
MASWRRAPFDVLKRVVGWGVSGLTILGCYGTAKLWSEDPSMLPLTALDRAIPFVPETVWIYGTVTWACLVAWLLVPNAIEARRLYLSIAVSTAVCTLAFIAFPTTFPRELYPLEPASASARELLDLRSADDPDNCFPSLHVALAWSVALSFRRETHGPWLVIAALVWAALVSVTTLTTKQHYVADVPAGLLVGVGAVLLSRRVVRRDARPFSSVSKPAFALDREGDRATIATLREKVAAHQWSLADLSLGGRGALDPLLVRLLNEVIYIEEIAGRNFRLLAAATGDASVKTLYETFADEETRHADGLRKVLAAHGAEIRFPGLGNSLVLDQFDALDPKSPADAMLVAVANPVFETFLDAGTIPFLQKHPALASPDFDEFVRRVCRDESAHLALTWILTRDAARRTRGLDGLRLLFNPNIYRGILAIPFMALDVYSLAYRLGYDYRTLLGPFGRLFRLHNRYPELAGSPLWWLFRLFVVCGVTATIAALALQKVHLFFGPFWTTLTRVTDFGARLLFGRGLLIRRGLPLPARASGALDAARA